MALMSLNQPKPVVPISPSPRPTLMTTTEPLPTLEPTSPTSEEQTDENPPDTTELETIDSEVTPPIEAEAANTDPNIETGSLDF